MLSQVRRLVVVESTALFDTAGIDLKPHKAVKVRTKGTCTHRWERTKLRSTEVFQVNMYGDISVLLNISVCVCAESGLFGVPLITLLDQDQRRAPGTKVPFILQRVRHGRFNTTARMTGNPYNN